MTEANSPGINSKQAPNADRHLAAIVTYSDDAIISKNLNGIITSWNKTAENIFGYTADEAIGKPITMIIPPELQHEEVHILDNIRHGIPIKHFETVRITKSGTRVPLSLTISPIKDETGTIIGASKTARDITDKKMLENELAHLAALVVSSSDAIWSISADGIVRSWNKGAEQLYRYPAHEIIGKPLSIVVPPDKQAEFESLQSQIEHGDVIESYETAQITRDGRRIHVSVSISPIKDINNNIIGVAFIARDITERKRLEQQRDEFMSIVTHELKTPVTSLKAFGQVLQTRFARQGDDQAVRLIGKMDAQINKLTNLINDLLDINRIEGGHLHFSMEQFSFDLLVKEIVEDIQPTTEQHTLVISGSTGTTMYGDHDRLGQVITNFLTNAIKYSPPAAQIDVRLAATERDVMLSVQDYGVGIPSDQLPHVFERFFRVQDKAHATVPGLGLGLYISREIILRHGGRIWVESAPGTGSTFYFTLPVTHSGYEPADRNGEGHEQQNYAEEKNPGR